MKKWIILTLFLGLSSALQATENMPINKIQIHRQHTINRQDELLDFLLKIPFEKRQYIFPMLSEQKDTPKKIKTHPDILVWKNKRPTRIAKRFQNDPELLEFLPAQFYYFLAPEMWPDEENTVQEENSNKLLVNLLSNPPQSGDAIIPENLIQLKNGLKTTYDFLKPLEKQQLKEKSRIYLSQILQENPVELESKLKDIGYSSVQDFAQKTDKIAMIYRQYLQGKKPQTSSEQQLVQNYISLIPFVFKNTGFELLLDSNLYSD